MNRIHLVVFVHLSCFFSSLYRLNHISQPFPNFAKTKQKKPMSFHFPFSFQILLLQALFTLSQTHPYSLLFSLTWINWNKNQNNKMNMVDINTFSENSMTLACFRKWNFRCGHECGKGLKRIYHSHINTFVNSSHTITAFLSSMIYSI